MHLPRWKRQGNYEKGNTCRIGRSRTAHTENDLWSSDHFRYPSWWLELYYMFIYIWMNHDFLLISFWSLLKTVDTQRWPFQPNQVQARGNLPTHLIDIYCFQSSVATCWVQATLAVCLLHASDPAEAGTLLFTTITSRNLLTKWTFQNMSARLKSSMSKVNLQATSQPQPLFWLVPSATNTWPLGHLTSWLNSSIFLATSAASIVRSHSWSGEASENDPQTIGGTCSHDWRNPNSCRSNKMTKPNHEPIPPRPKQHETALVALASLGFCQRIGSQQNTSPKITQTSRFFLKYIWHIPWSFWDVKP